MLLITLACALALGAGLGLLTALFGSAGLSVFVSILALWGVFSLFCLWFFRDPDPAPHPPAEAYLAPAHGVVDIIDEISEAEFMEGPCKRISIFLSVFDVHVQNAPVAGAVAYFRHHPGEFLNALNLDSAARNENVMLGFRSAVDPAEKVGVRLIAGLIARRIVPWASAGDTVAHGERISLIQFGSRVNVYLPTTARLQVSLKQRVRGGVTVLATRSS